MKVLMIRALLLSGILALSADPQCPGSGAFFHHAKCKMQVTAQSSCQRVRAEIANRIAGVNGWYDPHNRGRYTLTANSTASMDVKRLTGDGKYTDKLRFTFDDQGASCKFAACSESQVTSVIDYSTNYCNLHDLYCGTKYGCKIATFDFVSSESKQDCSQSDALQCLKV